MLQDCCCCGYCSAGWNQREQCLKYEGWTAGRLEKPDIKHSTLTAPKIHQFFIGKNISWIRSFGEHNDVLLTYWDMGHPWATGWRWPCGHVAMWPCGLLREADKLPNGYRGDTAEGLMDPLAKATCHISIRSVLVFFGVSCRPKVYESLLEDSFQISLQRSLFWYEANRKPMRTRVV